MHDRERYLVSLDINQLLELYEDIIRHSHYCPCECHCFDNWAFKYDKGEVKKRIIEVMGVKHENT